MAKSNRAYVGEGFELLAKGLEPFVERNMRNTVASGGDWAAEFWRRSRNPHLEYSKEDPSFQVTVILDCWRDRFDRKLSRSVFSQLHMLRSHRNNWAHNKRFDAHDTLNVLTSIHDVLEAVDASEQDPVAELIDELGRATYAKAADESGGDSSNVIDTPIKDLLPWREIVHPHPDVAARQFNVAEFAADLELVRKGEGATEYTNPVEFFERTYLTKGLRDLLSLGLQRTSGQASQPVINCQTNFGGGKTHSMIALYHLLSGVDLDSLPNELRELASSADVETIPPVSRAVLVGNRFNSGRVHEKADGTKVNTLWGELAYQLGGKEGYKLIAEADQSRTDPGDDFREVLKAASPCLILIDEWVAYARELYGRDDLTSGSFDSQFSFAQSLCETVKAVEGCFLVVSIPASEGASDADDLQYNSLEVGGTAGVEALKRLTHVVGRHAEDWTPASADESFEIVRRRMFQDVPEDKQEAMERCVAAFGQLYRGKQKDAFPLECRDRSYESRIRASFPIHPELFDRLYEDWATVERFQRTRGVLRLMAETVHSLWASDDQSPIILPCSVPLDNPRVNAELAGRLDAYWRPVIDTDIDGPTSKAAEVDRSVQHLGAKHATRRVGRTVFLGATPGVNGPNKGLEAERVNLGSTFPTESPAAFVPDALSRLLQQSSHLYTDRNRYWFDLQENVSRRARDAAEGLLAGDRRVIHDEISRRVQQQRQTGEFVRVHAAPRSSDDVADDSTSRLVILGPDQPHIAKAETSVALAAAKEILDNRGSSPRQYRNMLMFAACDRRALESLEQRVAEYLAWDDIRGMVTELNLDPQNQKQVEDSRAKADAEIGLKISAAYKYLINPHQDDPVGDTELEVLALDSQADGIAVRASRKAVNDGLLQVKHPAEMIRIKLDNELAPVWESGSVRIVDLWENYAKYLYLPRLKNLDVLVDASAGGPSSTSWREHGFATAADLVDERYLDLQAGAHPGVLQPTSLLVKPSSADAQAPPEPDPDGDGDGSGGDGDSESKDQKAGPSSFSATTIVDSVLYVSQFNNIGKEVIQHLVDSSDEVEITIEIRASRAAGFDDDTIRTVTTNTHALKFEQGGFG